MKTEQSIEKGRSCWVCRILPRPPCRLFAGRFGLGRGLNLRFSGSLLSLSLLLHQAVFPVETGETLSVDPRPWSPLLARAVPVPGGRPE